MNIARPLLLVALVLSLSGCGLFFGTRTIRVIHYPVQRGDSLYKIGQRFGASVDEIVSLNRIENPNSLEVGQIIKVPVRGEGGDRPAGSAYGEKPENIKPDESSMKLVRLSAARRYVGNLQWPVHGATVTSRFGRRWLTFHEGIDLRAEEGTPVYAAHSGVVVYNTDGIRGYGNLVILQGEGLITIYAHNRTVKVERGERVKRGDLISYSGSTGVSTGPHLHFETRIKDEKGLNVAIDPMTFYARR